MDITYQLLTIIIKYCDFNTVKAITLNRTESQEIYNHMGTHIYRKTYYQKN